MRNVSILIGCSLERPAPIGSVVDHKALRRKVFTGFALLLVLAFRSLEAREIHVRGDAAPGPEDGSVQQPYRTITRAVRAAQAGDTVLVAPVEDGYRETVNLHGLAGGTAEQPLHLDGQGSELVGADPLSPEGWQFDESSGAYTRSDVRPRVFLVVDGVMVFASKQTPAALEPGQWNEEGGMVYFKPPSGKALEALSIEACVRSNGVQVNGDTAHVVIKNFKARHFWNDGYNIHGKARALEFYNCDARDMGDEGFSSHGDAETLLDGAVYENCANGIFNVNTGGSTVTRNIIVRNPRQLGYGVTPRDGTVKHTLENAIFIECPVAVNAGKMTAVTNALVLWGGIAITLEHGGVLKHVAVSGDAVPFRANRAGVFELSEVSFNSGNPMQIRSGKSPAEVIRFDSCAVASGLKMVGGAQFAGSAFEILSKLGKDNREFPAMTTPDFLEVLLNKNLPGPAPELVRKAIGVLKGTGNFYD